MHDASFGLLVRGLGLKLTDVVWRCSVSDYLS